MEPQTLELAKQRAAQELELAPYRVAAEKQKATTALDQPGGIYLSYDAAGNLVQNEAIVRTDPLTGESETILVPKDIKTAEDVAAGRENTRALAAYRESLGQAAITNAAARTTASDAALKRAERPAAGQRGRGVTREISDTRGNPVGVGSYEYDANGRLVRLVITPAARKDVATGRLIQDQPYEMPLPGQIAEEPEGGPVAGTESTPVPVAPAGTDGPMAFTLGGVTYRADQTQAPATSPALPPAGASAATSPAPPAPVAPAADLASMAVNFPTPQALIAAIRSGQITPAQGREIARLNKFE